MKERGWGGGGVKGLHDQKETHCQIQGLRESVRIAKTSFEEVCSTIRTTTTCATTITLVYAYDDDDDDDDDNDDDDKDNEDDGTQQHSERPTHLC